VAAFTAGVIGLPNGYLTDKVIGLDGGAYPG
jgi:hypothetical protein